MPKYIEELVSQQVRRSELAYQRWADEGKVCVHPVVTISRRMGSGARVVAEILANKLGWSLWSKELLDAIAENADVSRKVVEAFDEKTISEIELFAHAALGNYEMGDFIYLKHLTKAIASIAKLGNVIILGRGADILLPDALHIRIDASDEYRIQNMMKYENLTINEAEAKIRESDRARQHFLNSAFGRERVMAVKHDLTIWMDNFRPNDAAEIIETAVKVYCRPND